MRGVAAIALCLLLTPSMSAQMRGGMHGGAFTARGSGGTGFSRRGSFVQGPRNGFVFQSGFRGRFFGPRFRHRFFYSSLPWGYGYPAYYGYYDRDYSNQSDPYAASAYAMANSFDERDRELQQQLDDLREDVARLTGAIKSEYPTTAAPPRPPAPREPATPTVLMFRDGTKQEVENYAIVGQTLWLFSEQRARKIPLSAIDLEATARANDERGLSFPAPR
ncbi:MAG: hypothetical protein DMG90_08565 [Acidobacteria bacterium]|nr:MAG: hypothetical protein DMG90_08565 [Acidobacteriota bacterium]